MNHHRLQTIIKINASHSHWIRFIEYTLGTSSFQYIFHRITTSEEKCKSSSVHQIGVTFHIFWKISRFNHQERSEFLVVIPPREMIKKHRWWYNNIFEAFSVRYVSLVILWTRLQSAGFPHRHRQASLIWYNMNYKARWIHFWGIPSWPTSRSWDSLHKLRYWVVKCVYIACKRMGEFTIIHCNNTIFVSLIPEGKDFALSLTPCNKEEIGKKSISS